MEEERFEDAPEALKEKDYQRYIPKPYMNYFKSVQFYSDRDEKIQPKGVTADYRGYAKAQQVEISSMTKLGYCYGGLSYPFN